MALKRIFKKKFHGITMKSGHVYTFRYQAWENDPEPTIILMYAIEGTHSNTGHQWRLFQGINFTYIPRSVRKLFIKDWMDNYEKSNGNTKFTWEIVKRKYPQLKHAVRRYFFKPSYYITKIKEVPFDDIEKIVISSWSKDFSKKVKRSLLTKFKKIMKKRTMKI